MYVYLDASNSVVATSTTEYTVAEAQARVPTVDSRIDDGPDGLNPVGSESDATPYHHRLASGDGSSFSDYEPAHAYDYSIVGDTNNGALAAARLAVEVAADATITTALARIGGQGDAFWVVFESDLSAGEQTALDSVVAAHLGLENREPTRVIEDPVIEPIVPDAAKVVANDRPAIEIQSGATGFAALQGRWPLPQSIIGTMTVAIKFILKTAGTGSNVRIAARFKSEGVGDDSSAAFTESGFAVVPVTYTTVGQVFGGAIELDASSAELDNVVALQIGRDGANEFGAGTDDDVSVAIQIIDVKVEAT